MNKATMTVLAGGLASIAAFAAEGTSQEGAAPERVVRSAEGLTSTREHDTLRDSFTFEKSSVLPEEAITRPKSTETSVVASGTSGDIWIYDATSELFFDADGDGYYHYLRVRFDADTIYDHVYVYANLYLSEDGQVWELYYSTDDFAIEGTSSFDEYEVETELVAGYPPGLYDVLIELYDADFGVLVDEFGPFESPDLSLLPLEDLSYDSIDTPSISISDGYGGAGTASWGLISALLAGVAWRRRQRRLFG